MNKRITLLLLALCLVFIAVIIFRTEIVFAKDSVYNRNGEVYVMIGSGPFKGVYANQSINATGDRVTIPGGKLLFGAKDEYYSISADQFRNIYVLSAFTDPSPAAPAANTYYPIDPPASEGIVGIGADANGDLYYDVINYASSINCSYHGALDFSFPRRLCNTTIYYDNTADDGLGPAPQPPANIKQSYIDKYSGAVLSAALSNPPKTTPQFVSLTFPNGTILNDKIPANNSGIWWGYDLSGWHWGTWSDPKPMATIPNLDPNQIRRISKVVKTEKDAAGNVTKTITGTSGSWYPGYFVRWYYHGALNDTSLQGAGNWQRRYEFKKQYIKLWVTQWVDQIPPGLDLGGLTLPPARTENDVEVAFNTTNISYKADFGSGCGEDHADTQLGVSTIIATEAKLSLSTTGAGRRYTYASMPVPSAKKGQISFIKDGTGTIQYGIPVGGSTGYGGSMGGGLPLTTSTLAIGAATKDENEDWVYAAPLAEDGMDVIDFCVADQWDGKGGVLYRLLKSGAGKKLKWNKYDGYTPINAGGIQSGTIPMANDVKCIAADGRGSVYYLTDARPVIDNGSTPLGTFDPIDPSKPVAVPIKITEDGKISFKWYREYQVRAATELFSVDYYTQQTNKINDFTVGTEKIRVLEVFQDAAGTQLISRGTPLVIGTAIKDIKLDLATINLAGPPTGNEERNVVDIASSNSSLLPNESFTSLGTLSDTIPQNQIDQIAEDTQYRASMENAPPEFTNDVVNINKRSGTWLKTHDTNKNGIFGGFLYSIRPGTASYFWKVEMIQPMKKVISTQIEFPTTAIAAAPDGWPPAPPNAPNINWADWRVSKPGAEGGPEALPDFKFTPKEPGIYKISMMASVKRYKYEDMPYPSYLPQRNDPKYKPNTPEFLFFDNGEGGGVAGNGTRDGNEGYIAERYVYVTAKATVSDGYVSNIKITGDGVVDENQAGIWTAKATFRYAKSFRHETQAAKMETYNGIGSIDYPANIRTLLGIGPYDNVGENYDAGAAANASNSPAGAAANIINTELRNFGEKPPGAVLITDPTTLGRIKPGAAPVWGTAQKQSLWIEGSGTQTNPDIPLNIADRGAVSYEWYLAAENVEKTGNDKFIGWKTNTREPGILIAKGTLADEKPFPGDASKKAVTWKDASYKNSDRKFEVDINLRYAFDMPLDPGRYFLYIKFSYPKMKWEGRAPKKDAGGNFMQDAAGNNLYSFYDLVVDGGAGSSMPSDYAAGGGLNTTIGEPFGFVIVVRDKQSPQAFFTGNDPTKPNPDYEVKLNDGTIPAGGVAFKGATTGDPYPDTIRHTLCDNNPNMKLKSALKIKSGPNTQEFMKDEAWRDFGSEEKEDIQMNFTEDAVKKTLERTINPISSNAAPGTVQDAVIIPVNEYPGYGKAPFRRARYELAPMKVTKDHVPYDFVGDMPVYATGEDESGNIVSNASCDIKPNGALTEEILIGRTDANPDIHHQNYSNAPAFIAVQDNDSPTLIFKSLRPRDNLVREYFVKNSALKPNQEFDAGDDPSYHDTMDWDTALPGKLRANTYGSGSLTIKDINLNGQETAVDSSKVVIKQIDKYNIAGGDLGVGMNNGEPAYLITFNSRNIVLSKTHYDFRPVNLAYYDMDSVSTLEIIEDSRSKFEIAIRDNVDGNITPTVYKFPADGITIGTTLGTANFFVDTINLAEAETLAEVMNGWGIEGSWLRTYGVFRNPTPPSNPKPYMFFIVKDSSDNATAAKVPAEILHTFMRNSVINVETRRTE